LERIVEQIKVSEMVAALSYALDLTEGQPMGHSARVCVLGMRVAAEIGMAVDERAELYYTLLIKDAGCSSNASRLFHILAADELKAKANVRATDWTRVGCDNLRFALSQGGNGKSFLSKMRTMARFMVKRPNMQTLVKIRCERGASVARQMGFSERVADGIQSLDELWDGQGHPDGLAGEAIPLYSRIALLCQTLEVFWRQVSAERALEVVKERAGRWFDPNLVRAVASIAARGELWTGLDSQTLLQDVWALEPVETRLVLTDARMDSICLALAEVVDAKSPFTYRHSNGVAEAAQAIGATMGMAQQDLDMLRRAALLHDIGKLSVPNSILEKPGKLDADEWAVVKRHPHYSHEILRRVPGFGQLSEVAASHHEKLDGTGYFRGYDEERLSLPARILAVADIYDALAAKRPYRDAMPLERVLNIMEDDSPRALDADCVTALKESKLMDARGLMGLESAVREAVQPAADQSAAGRRE
jgi:putative nucleotidyltransferase with HDIG domain